MKLTEADIQALQTPRGGFLAETVSALGENVTIKGWRIRLIGRTVPDHVYASALARVSAGRICNRPFARARPEPRGQAFLTLA